MQLINISIDRIIIHQIFQRDSEGNKVDPIRSHEYTNFDVSAMATFKKRVIDALGESSKAVQMEIAEQGAGKLPALVDVMIDQDNDSFAVSSFDLAERLADAQHTKGIPGGIVVVFSGRYGHPEKKFLGIIKAEIHNGYEVIRDPVTNEVSMKFVEEVLLTPGTRLYKTAGFFEKAGEYEGDNLNNKWAVMVSDYQITKAEGKASAIYFFSDFLRCRYPQTSARTTMQFYEATKTFISGLEVSPAEKSGLLNALTTYLKVDTSSTVGAREFADRYFDTDTHDAFTTYMEDAGLPATSFTKDLEHIEKQLKFRRVSFSRDVRISAPSQVFKDLVTIEKIDGEPDESGAPMEWTRVTIKDRIVDQE